MKTTLLIITTLFFLLLIPHNSHAATIGLPLHNSGLVGYWNMNEGTGGTTYDRSGNGNHGSFTGLTADDWVDSNDGLGKALDFDGDGDYVDVGNSSNLDLTGDLTISLWFNADELDNPSVFRTFISKRDSFGGMDWELFYDHVTGNSIQFWYGNSGSTKVFDALGVNPSLNTWHHLVITRNGNDWTMWLDGVNKGSDTASAAMPTGDSVRIGVIDPVATTHAFDGELDEVRLYNRALSDSEINRLYNLTKPKVTKTDNTGLVGYWPFEDGQGTTAGDHSFNSNHGTLNTMDDSDWVDGKIGKALDFDGSSDYINVASPGLPTGDFTYSAWVNLDTNTDEMIFMASNGSGGNEFFMYVESTTAVRLNIDNTAQSFLSATVSAGVWTHITATRNGNTTTVYIDGVSKGTKTQSGTLNFSSCSLLIGVDSDSGCVGSLGNYLDGKIDEVRIYNRALDAAEVEKLYKGSKRTVINKTKKNRITNGLVGHWTFDGPDLTTTTAADSSGNGNNGTLTNGPKPTLGKIGQALEFDGDDDYVLVPDDDSLESTSQISVSAWVKIDESADTGHVVSKRHGTDDSWLLDYGILNASNLTWTIDTGSPVSSVWGTSLSTGTWYHVVGTWDGSTQKIYVDGEEKDSDAQTGTMTDQTYDLKIGDRPNVAGVYFDGKIDEVRIYNRALSADEVSELYNMGL